MHGDMVEKHSGFVDLQSNGGCEVDLGEDLREGIAFFVIVLLKKKENRLSICTCMKFCTTTYKI